MIKVNEPVSLLDSAHSNPVTWYIVFGHAKNNYWFSPMLKVGFTHLYAVKFDGYNWIKVEPYTGYVDISILPFTNEHTILDVVNPDYSDILLVKRWCKRDFVRSPLILGPVTCVEAMLSLLGIRAPLVWTPWQLYKYLRKDHGKQTEGGRSISRATRAA